MIVASFLLILFCVKFIQNKHLAGICLNSVDMDDHTGKCLKHKWPYLTTVHNELRSSQLLRSDNEQSEKCNFDGKLPDLKDCYSYYECQSGVKVKKRCNHGRLFNSQTRVCDWNMSVWKCFQNRAVNPKSKPQNDLSNQYKLLCYITNWSFSRTNQKFTPENLDQDLCTHNVYAYAYLDEQKLALKESNPYIDVKLNFYKKTTSLKKPTLLAVGGWTDSQTSYDNVNKYSKLCENEKYRRKFITNTIDFLNKYGFRGLILEWFYPVCWNSKCDTEHVKDRKNFARLLREIAQEFKKQNPPLTIAITISGYKDIIEEAYDLSEIWKDIDFINVLTIDYHGNWENETSHPTSIYKQPHDKYIEYNINYIIDYLIKKNVPKNKIILATSFYGHSFRLKNSKNNGLGAAVEGNPEASKLTLQRGILAYMEICEMIKNKEVILNKKKSQIEYLPYAYNNDLWVGFDNVESLKYKVNYVKSNKLGGISAWSVDLDDFANVCCQQQYPLLRTLSSELKISKKTVSEIGTKCGIRPIEVATITNKIPTTGYYTVYLNQTHTTHSTNNIISTNTIESTTKHQIFLEGQPCDDQYHKHESDCAKYYQCMNNVYIQRECGNGLHWNSKINTCDYATDAKCKTNSSIIPDNEIDQIEEKIEKLCKESDKPIHAFGCRKYVICLNNKAHIVNCPKGKVFDPSGCKCIKSDFCLNNNKTDYDSSLELTTTKIKTLVNETKSDLEYKIICYFTNWAVYRDSPMNFKPEDIDYDKCTHIVYAFATLNENTFTIQAHDKDKDIIDGFYKRVVKNKKPKTRVLIGLGGWNDSKGNKYSKLVHDPKKRSAFIKHVIEFLKEYNFDGLDLDWEYPKCWQVECERGPNSDKESFTEFVKELRIEFDKYGYLLSAAVSPSLYVAPKAYEVKKLSEYLDWIGVMNYDYHGIWERKTGHVAPLYPRNDDSSPTLNIHSTITYYLDKNIDSRKLILGIPFYGKSFVLNSKYNYGLNAAANRAGYPRKFTKAEGTIAYYEICTEIQEGKWNVVKDPKLRHGPYAYNDNEWISYDDPEILVQKIDYVKKHKLGGSMIWALDFDDFTNVCGQGKNPLLTTIHNSVHGINHTTITLPQVTTSTYYKPSHTTTAVTTTTNNYHKDEKFKVVCYFTNWSWYRQGTGKFLPENIDPNLCTHVVYAFAVLNGNDFVIKSHDSWADIDNKFYWRITELKKKGIKVLIGIGGWNDSAGSKYSQLVNSAKKRKKFNASLMQFIQKYNFDGADLDWEYPKCWQVDCNKGPDSDKESFSLWIKELHEMFQPYGYLLSAAVSPAKKVIDAGYDVPILSKYLDWIAVMCYDYYGKWDKKTGHVAPLYKMPGYDETYNADFTISYWIQKGADPRKLVMGIPTYGRSFTLVNAKQHSFLAPTTGGAQAGIYTRESGFLAYYEICLNVHKNFWTINHDEKNRSGPYAYRGNEWVGFDNGDMIRIKSQYIKNHNLGGAMIWALDLDDFNNVCQCESYPLLKIINRVLRNYNKNSNDYTCKLNSTAFDENDLFTTTKGTTQWTWTQENASPITWWSPSSTTSNYIIDNNINPSYNTEMFLSLMKCSYSDMFKHHESNCNKYYQCVHGHWLEKKCPNGLHWSGNNCDWPSAAKCKF